MCLKISLPKFIEIFITCSLISTVSAQAQVQLFVDPEIGSDLVQNGSRTQPLKSVEFALSKANEGTQILLLKGIYREHIRIEKNNITIRAVEDGVIWDGTEEVKLDRNSSQGNWQAALNRQQIPNNNIIEQIFSSNKNHMLWEARWPNASPEQIWVSARQLGTGWARLARGTGIIDNNSARIIYSGPANFGNISKGEKVKLIYNGYSQFRTLAKTATFDKEGSGFKLIYDLDSNCTQASSSADIAPCSQKHNSVWWEDDLFYIFGHKSLLDNRGEWYFDSDTKKLEVILNNNEPTVHVKVRPFAITIDSATNIRIEGIHFFATAVRVLSEKESRSKIVEIVENKFEYPSWDRMLADNNKSHPKYRAAFPATDGISLDGDNILFKDNLVEKGGTYGVFLNGSFNTVINNVFKDIDWFGNLEHAPIIMTNQSTPSTHPVNGKILNNTIFNFGNTGIRFFGPKIEVGYNNIFNGGLLSLDTAMIYTARTYAHGSRIHHNFVHNGTGIGIRLDGYSVTGMTVDRNVIWNVRRGMKISGFNNKVLNNTIDVDNPTYSLLVEWGEEQKGIERGGKQNRRSIIANNLAYRIHYRDRGASSSSKTEFGELYNYGNENNPQSILDACSKK